MRLHAEETKFIDDERHQDVRRDRKTRKGAGAQIRTRLKAATMGRKETKLLSHGFTSAFLSALFMGGPQACSAPAIRMMG